MIAGLESASRIPDPPALRVHSNSLPFSMIRSLVNMNAYVHINFYKNYGSELLESNQRPIDFYT